MSDPDNADREAALLRLGVAIADGAPVDWESEKRSDPGIAASAPGLRLVQAVAAAHAEHTGVAGDQTLTQAGADRGIARAWGPLRIAESLGSGGFGEVYRAYDPALQRDVALKLCRGDRFREASGRARFLREARQMARLRHPNILVVHGVDEHDGQVGLWTDLLRGETLEQMLAARGPQSADEAALVGIELCRALAAVHAAGLVHGDVKTSNIMREQGGRIVLMDFGSVTERDTLEMTGDGGNTSGTPLFMAPECLEGARPTAAADLYALGVVLYRLVTGRFPIEATTLNALRAQHQRREHTPLRDRRPDLPVHFIQAIERALAFEPAERFQSAGAMETGLALATGVAGPRGGAAPARQPRWLRAVAAAALVAVAILVVALVRRSGAPQGGDPDKAAGDAPATMAQAMKPQENLPADEPGRTDPAPRQTADAARPGPAEHPAAPAGHPGSVPLAPASPAAGGGAAGGPAADGAATNDAAAGSVPAPGGVAPAGVPALTARLTFYRSGPQGIEMLIPGAQLRKGDALYAEVEGSAPMHLYILNEDERGAAFLLFPLPGLQQQNPLLPGSKHRLPGALAGRNFNWTVTSAGGAETILAIASRSPLEELERDLADLPPAGSTVAPVYPRLSRRAIDSLRGIGGVAPDPGDPATTRLSSVLGSITGRPDAPDDLWLFQVQFRDPAP